MRKIIFTRPDGRFSVRTPEVSRAEGFREADAEERAMNTLPLGAINAKFVDDIPEDRTFRSAWKHGGDKIDFDMYKALEIQKDILRKLRAPLLADLDIQLMRAVEAGDTKAQADIAAQKQALRDVTDDPALTEAKTLEELKAVIPSVLGAVSPGVLARP